MGTFFALKECKMFLPPMPYFNTASKCFYKKINCYKIYGNFAFKILINSLETPYLCLQKKAYKPLIDIRLKIECDR